MTERAIHPSLDAIISPDRILFYEHFDDCPIENGHFPLNAGHLFALYGQIGNDPLFGDDLCTQFFRTASTPNAVCARLNLPRASEISLPILQDSNVLEILGMQLQTELACVNDPYWFRFASDPRFKATIDLQQQRLEIITTSVMTLLNIPDLIVPPNHLLMRSVKKAQIYAQEIIH